MYSNDKHTTYNGEKRTIKYVYLSALIDMLLVQPIDTSAQSLPSPNQLKGRVIIKV